MNIINDNLNILNMINDNSLDEIKTNDIINKSNDRNSKINDNDEDYLNNKIYIKKLKKLSNIKYGIDENGNPINIFEYYKKANINKKKPRLIAYITKDETKNELIDLNGNKIIKKNKDGDYEFPYKLNILIKDFDVQHPELRINGERTYNIQRDSKENNININNIEKENKIPIPINSIYGRNNMNSSRNYLRKFILREKTDCNNSKFMKKMKLRYDTPKNDISYFNNKNISFKKDKTIKKRKSKYISLNRTNLINATNNEVISRTNNILNMSKSNDNKYRKYRISHILNNQRINGCYSNILNDNVTYHNYTTKNSFISPKIITNHISNKNIDIDANKIIDYAINLNSGSSPILKKNNINKKNNIHSHNHIYSDNSEIIKIKNKSFINNSSLDINKNKSINNNNNNEKLIYNDINNTINNFINISNSKYNKKIIIKNKKKEYVKCNTNHLDYTPNKKNLIINNYLKNNKQQSTAQESKNKKINSKLSFNHIKNSTLKTIESSCKKRFKVHSKINNNKKINNNISMNIIKKSKLISKIIPPNSLKKMKYSILTSEANDMIKNFSKNKKEAKSRNIKNNNSILDNQSSLNRYISSPVINIRNKSFE